jgi:hypothetical protein
MTPTRPRLLTERKSVVPPPHRSRVGNSQATTTSNNKAVALKVHSVQDIGEPDLMDDEEERLGSEEEREMREDPDAEEEGNDGQRGSTDHHELEEYGDWEEDGEQDIIGRDTLDYEDELIDEFRVDRSPSCILPPLNMVFSSWESAQTIVQSVYSLRSHSDHQAGSCEQRAEDSCSRSCARLRCVDPSYHFRSLALLSVYYQHGLPLPRPHGGTQDHIGMLKGCLSNKRCRAGF